MNANLEKETKTLPGRAARFARQHIAARPELGSTKRFPETLWRRMGEEGLLGLTICRDYGGAEAPYPEIFRCGQALVRWGGNLGVAVSWMIHLAVARFLLQRLGNARQRGSYLPAMARGTLTGSLAVSEPDTGAHPRFMETTARFVDGRYVLDGQKTYLTNGPIADFFVVVAVTGEKEGKKAFSALLVDRGTPGLTVLGPMKLPFLRPSPHGGIKLTRCELESHALLGPAGTAYETIVKPFRALEDVLMMGPMVGGLARLCHHGVEALRSRGGSVDPKTLDALGRVQCLLECLRTVGRVAAQGMEEGRHSPETLALQLGFRDLVRKALELLDRILEDEEVPLSPAHTSLRKDLEAAAGIARNVAKLKRHKLALSLLEGDH